MPSPNRGEAGRGSREELRWNERGQGGEDRQGPRGRVEVEWLATAGKGEWDGGRGRVEVGVSAGDLGAEGMCVAETAGDGRGNWPRLWFGENVVSPGVEGAVWM